MIDDYGYSKAQRDYDSIDDDEYRARYSKSRLERECDPYEKYERSGSYDNVRADRGLHQNP